MATMRNTQAVDQRSVDMLSSALVANKVIDQFDMNWAVRESQRRAKPLTDVLVELELVSPLELQSCFESLKRLGKISD